MLKKIKKSLAKATHGRLIVFLSGVAFSVLMAGLYVHQPAFLKALDFKVYDALLSQTYTSETTDVPVIVDLDERSLAEYGQWQWPRYRVALLLAKIRQAGAKAVGLDILFAEPDRTSPQVLQEHLKRDLKVNIDFTGMPDALKDNDKVLAGVLATGPYVLGYFFDFAHQEAQQTECTLHPVSTSFIRSPGTPEKSTFLYNSPSVVCNLKVLGDAAPADGFFNTDPDVDGILRRTPLVIQYKDKFYPSLSLGALMQALGLKQVTLKLSSAGVESLRIGKSTVIPVDRKGQMLIKWRGKTGAFRYISAAKVLGDKLEKDELAGKIVFVGTSAAGLKDIRATPLDKVFPGVETHATVVDNILKQDFISQPASAAGIEFSLIIGAGLLTAVLLTWTRAVWSVVPVGGCAFAMWQGAALMLDRYGMYISPFFSLITLVGNFGLLTLIKFWREEGQKKFLQATFSSYLSPELIDDMFKNKTMPELGGEARTITAYFTDIQGFSTFSEVLTAHQVVELLNEYLSSMTDILIDAKGTLDKYEGDAIIAFFGAPMELPDHALRSCRVAVGMQKALDGLREKWAGEKRLPDEPERNTKNLPAEQWGPEDKWPKIVHEMKMRIGVNSGEIVVGNMGSAMRMNYTMMGDPVNLAARLEAGAKQYGIYSAVSEYTLDLEFSTDGEGGEKKKIRDMVEARFIDNITVVGKSEPVKVYELCAMKGELTDQEKRLFEIFDQAMRDYLNMEWDKAIVGFKEALKFERVPDGKTTPSEVFIKRCEMFKEEPPVSPGETWDGVFRLTSK
ncbi:MAG: adenylate/guanylate cyclase domain-containing protein [Thermodesulfobacteriota bacterium]|nr:adenylate/guanylate cyclase domain-containing protein [Thermodesulfobacteriota bacterium]